MVANGSIRLEGWDEETWQATVLELWDGAAFREEIRDAGTRPLRISTDRPARLQPLMASLLEEPSDPRSLDEWAA